MATPCSPIAPPIVSRGKATIGGAIGDYRKLLYRETITS
jgi:hypothetical protein